MRRPEGLLDGAARALSTRLASGMTRRSFLGRMGGAVLAATGGAAVAALDWFVERAAELSPQPR